MKAFKKLINKIINNEYVKAFALIYLFGLICFSFAAIKGDFTLPIKGDYTLQTYAFYSQGYKIFWEFIKTGEYPLFDFSNFLGANYLGTQSFYYVFSPLFYLLCLWPEKLLYQGIFFLLVFKYTLGGFFMYILLKKYFSVSNKMSILGGLIYAFSGFSLFYLWFHFSDIISFFPLFIIGIEKCLKERKGTLLTIATFLCGLTNYFFLVNFVIFGVLYAIYRWLYIYGINNKKGYSFKVRYGVLLQGILHCMVGVMMCAICLLPSLHVVLETNRNTTSSSYLLQLLSIVFVEPTKVDGSYVLGELKSFKDIFSFNNFKELVKVLFVWEDRTINTINIKGKTNIGYILSNWLFMNTNCWDNIMFDNEKLDNSLGGFFISTPLTMLLIPSVIKEIKTKRPLAIIGVILCIILPFLPITSHAAFAFTSLYGRWQIWIVLIAIIFILPTLDKFELVNRRLITINLVVNLLLAAIVFNISKESGKFPKSYMFNIFGRDISGMVIIALIEILVMLLVWFIYRFKLFKPAIVKNIMIVIVVLEVGASTIITTEQQGYHNWDEFYLSQPQYQELDDMISSLQEEDKDFYRIMNTEATRSITNLPSQLNYNGASTFNSTYSFALDKFKNTSRMAYGGSWSMGNHEKRYWFDQYIGSKYYVIDKFDINNDNALYHMDNTDYYDGRTSKDQTRQDYKINLPWSYKLYKEGKYYDIYINENFSSIGYSVDYFMEYVSSKNSSYYEELYSTTALLEKDVLEKVVDLLPEKENIELIDGQEVITYKKQEPTTYKEIYRTFPSSEWDYYFSPREDVAIKTDDQVDVERPIYKLNNGINKDEISSYLKENNQFLHTRWVKKGYFGDQFILKLKPTKKPLAANATADNMAYLNIKFKLGPKVLISLYNKDTLVTQDAHMNSFSSLSPANYEWKEERGFYVDQPIDKIVIEFVSDTNYSQLFGNRSSLDGISITYSYQNDIENRQNIIKENMLSNVVYKNNTFTFNSNTTTKKIVVTNIPYDDGWTLTCNNKKKDIFIVNGGFIGFISEEGQTNYKLSYFTPNLKEGFAVSLTGLILLIVLYFIYKNKRVPVLLIQQQIEDVYYIRQSIDEKNQIKQTKEKINKLFKRKGK